MLGFSPVASAPVASALNLLPVVGGVLAQLEELTVSSISFVEIAADSPISLEGVNVVASATVLITGAAGATLGQLAAEAVGVNSVRNAAVSVQLSGLLAGVTAQVIVNSGVSIALSDMTMRAALFMSPEGTISPWIEEAPLQRIWQ